MAWYFLTPPSQHSLICGGCSQPVSDQMGIIKVYQPDYQFKLLILRAFAAIEICVCSYKLP